MGISGRMRDEATVWCRNFNDVIGLRNGTHFEWSCRNGILNAIGSGSINGTDKLANNQFRWGTVRASPPSVANDRSSLV